MSLKRLSFDWDKLSTTIITALAERERVADEGVKGAYYISCVERCRTAQESLLFSSSDPYSRWVHAECQSLFEAFNSATWPSEQYLRALMARVTAMAAIVAYCVQFRSDLGVDGEFLYILYERVLKEFKLSPLTQSP